MPHTKPDLPLLYRQMLRSRLFEEAVRDLWQAGWIPGEMHLGLGEEAICAGIVMQLRRGDAMALDHRGTPPLLMRGIDPDSLLKEFMGAPDGLCGGMGGHMHLFAPEQLTASSGIVGAAGPTAAGFGLAAQQLRPGTVSLAFFGEGAVNQGMLMEAFNLAAVWKLPVLFVCKDNNLAITTASDTVTGGRLADRARGFGLAYFAADGADVEAVWRVADKALRRARRGDGPSFLHFECVHPEGHFLGDPLIQIARQPGDQLKQMAPSLLKAAVRGRGASVGKRVGSLTTISRLVGRTALKEIWGRHDPLAKCRKKMKLDPRQLDAIAAAVKAEIEAVVARATNAA
ncbi:MAG: thiamine pyrophosphate-dependent dehydrogenase E1 component subunit alpha [Desulfobacterales bacterium]|nr:thiamine pyrophosphate-dependent dehydrogenase E1 component subunit alpha [Desulfobacterales bacterium]